MQTVEWNKYRIICNEQVVMPAPAVAHLLPRLLHLQPDAYKTLDLATGSGCIARWLSDTLKPDSLTVTDISPAALELAQQNCPNITKAIECSWFESVIEKYTLIVCNPPLGTEQEWTDNTWAHDRVPKAAVCAGAQGTEALEQILSRAKNYLEIGGHLALFHTPEQAAYVHTYPHGLRHVAQWQWDTMQLTVLQLQPRPPF